MSERRTLPCLACGQYGIEGKDVRSKLVRFPPSQQRTVQVAITTVEDQHGVKGFEYRDAQEEYAGEYRCIDVDACAERVMQQTPPPAAAPEPEPIEEAKAWLL